MKKISYLPLIIILFLAIFKNGYTKQPDEILIRETISIINELTNDRHFNIGDSVKLTSPVVEPNIEWAGDLNNDGKTDYIVHTPGDGYVSGTNYYYLINVEGKKYIYETGPTTQFHIVIYEPSQKPFVIWLNRPYMEPDEVEAGKKNY